jgi:hypothetical protein
MTSIQSVPSRASKASHAWNIQRRDRPRWFGPGPIGLHILVARTQVSRSALIARPTISSERPSL